MPRQGPPTPAPGGDTAQQNMDRIEAERVKTPEELAALAEADADYLRMMEHSRDSVARERAEPRDNEIDREPNDPYDYNSPLANRMPDASSVTSFTLVGQPAVWISQRENLLSSVREQDAPFNTTEVPIGMNRLLTQEEADLLNARFPT